MVIVKNDSIKVLQPETLMWEMRMKSAIMHYKTARQDLEVFRVNSFLQRPHFYMGGQSDQGDRTSAHGASSDLIEQCSSRAF